MGFYARVGKRVMDVVGAVVALPVVAAATVVVAPLIWADDRGPVFYASQRRGRDGRHFTMYKFRTMTVNAQDLRNADLSTVTSDRDPRVTRVGRILRKTSVDELPQFLNVLLGDMSLVGPRPNMTRQRWEDLTEVERKRVSVRPGITGWSQATVRNSAPTAEKYARDVRYVEELSFGLDLRILAMTVTSVVAAKNINAAPAQPGNPATGDQQAGGGHA